MTTKKWRPTRKDIMTDDLLRKSHSHYNKQPVPLICNTCKGSGLDIQSRVCPTCFGEGTIEGEE